MRDRIAEAAKNNKRSMNSEIISALERAFPTFEAEDAEIHPDEWREQKINTIMEDIENLFRQLKDVRSMKWPAER